MLKKIWMPFLALAITGGVVGCSSDISETSAIQNTKTKDIGFVLPYSDSTKLSVRDFALAHCHIMNEMVEIHKAEFNAGREMNEDILATIANMKNVEEGEAILVMSGMDPSNAAQMVVLANRNEKNYNAFIKDNPDFAKLDSETKKSIFEESIIELIGENADDLFPPNDIENYTDPADICIREKKLGLHDCFVAMCVDVGVGFFGGVFGVAAACIALPPVAAICERTVMRDYRNCMKDAGIPSIFW